MQNISMLLPLAWRNLWRNPRRTFVTLAVVVVGLYSVLVLGALLDAWAESSRNVNLNLLTGHGQIHAKGYLDDPTIAQRMSPPDDTLVSALDKPDIVHWVTRVRVPAVIQSEYKTLPLTLLGVHPKEEARISTIPHQLAEGSYLADSDDAGIVLGRHLAERLKTRIGKRVVVMAQAEDGSLAERAYKVKGLFAGNQNAEDAYAFTGMATAQAMLNIDKDISEISFTVTDDAALGGIIERLRHAAPTLDIEPWQTLSPMTEAINILMHTMVYIWLSIMCAFMAIGIVNTQLMAVFERTREFGLLQALGMRPRQILIQVLLESAMLIGIGVTIAMVTATLTIIALHNGIDLTLLARGAEYLGAGHMLYPKLSLAQFISLSFIVWVLGIAIALWPAYRASRANPVEAMHYA